jgi:7-cyano-7-deazaguanine synthase in queuosine biosynthesis
MEQAELRRYITNQRGWSLRQPVKEPIVLLLTGGLDSSLLAEICVHELKSMVYPLYIRRGSTTQEKEEQAAKSVTTYLQSKYGGRKIKDLVVLDCTVPPTSLRKSFSKNKIIQSGWPMRNTILELYAIQYAFSLDQKGVHIRTVATGSVDDDIHPDSQPISFLATTLATCVNLNDWSWQVMAPYLQTGIFPDKSSLSKKDIVEWGREHSFPFHITYSCPQGAIRPCGTCKDCKIRKKLLGE